MSPNPQAFLNHLRTFGYHPRSDKHSNALALAIVDDLVTYCPRLAEKAAAGETVFDLNFGLKAGTAEWNVDLVLGTPELGSERSETERGIPQTFADYRRNCNRDQVGDDRAPKGGEKPKNATLKLIMSTSTIMTIQPSPEACL